MIAKEQKQIDKFMKMTSVGLWCFRPENPVADNLPEQDLIEIFFNSSCVSCNAAYARMLDMTEDEVIGLKLQDLFPRTEDNINHLLSFIRNGFKITDGVSREILSSGKEKIFTNSLIASVNNGMLTEACGTKIDISESRNAVNALRETERRVATMIDNLPGIAYQCTIDANWTMKFISKNAFELTGYQGEDLLDNKNIAYGDIILPGDRVQVNNTIELAVSNNQPFQIEYRIKTRAGKIKWVWEQGRKVQVQDLDEPMLEGLIMDITEMKSAQIRLEIMQNISIAFSHTRDLSELIGLIERELSKLINTRNFLIALYDEKTDSFSLPYMKDDRDHFKVTSAYKTISALVIREKQSMLLKRHDIEKLEKTGQIIRVGSPAKCWLGVPLQVEDKATGVIVLQDYDDEYAIGIEEKELIEFVSTQVAASIFKKQADDEIRRLYQSIQQSPVSVVITDIDKKIIYVNQKFIEVTGYSREEAIGKTPNLIESEKADKETYNCMWSVLDSGNEFQGEFLHQKKNGELFWERAFVSPVKNDKDKTTHYIAVKEDITTRRKMEEDLVKAKEKAEESDRLKTAFLANMSHEIRTPMNAIIGFTEMLHDGIVVAGEREKLSGMIIDNGRKLLNIIDDIVDIAKIEAGQLAISPGRCSANKILFDHYYNFKELRSRIGKEHIEIIARQYQPDKNFTFTSDARRINQVITNLMSNALKYTLEGEIELGYEIRKGTDGPIIDFFVKDTGIGIHASKFKTIFDRFRQLDDSSTRHAGGTGLGLAISRSIARLLGGEMKVESTFGKGSTFHLILPFVEIRQDRFEPPKIGAVAKSMDWANFEILIAEDQDSNFHLLEIILRETNVKIIRAYNGKEAIDFIRGGKEVDLILMDVRMPLMDGYEATALIKKIKPEIPIIAQTAYALSGDREISLEAGCDDYISKPIKKQELMGVISKYFNK